MEQEEKRLNCQYCGKESWLSAIFRDNDFCTPGHRRKFHQRLQHVMRESNAANVPTSVAGPKNLISPSGTFEGFAPSVNLRNATVLKALRRSGLSFDRGLVDMIVPSQAELQAQATVVAEEERDSVMQVVAEPVPVEPSSPVLVLSRPAVQDARMQRVTDLIANLRNHTKGRAEGSKARRAS